MSRLKLPLIAMLLAGALLAGWQARGWHEDSQRLTAERATQQAIDAVLARESSIARAVEARLAELEANERIIDRGIIREVQKPIYQRVCLGDDVIRLLNDAAAGRRPDPAESAAPLSGSAAGAN